MSVSYLPPFSVIVATLCYMWQRSGHEPTTHCFSGKSKPFVLQSCILQLLIRDLLLPGNFSVMIWCFPTRPATLDFWQPIPLFSLLFQYPSCFSCYIYLSSFFHPNMCFKYLFNFSAFKCVQCKLFILYKNSRVAAILL